MTPDESLALASFLAGCAVGLALSGYFHWVEKRRAARDARRASRRRIAD